MKYDYMIAGRWRNRDEIRKVLDKVRAAGRTAYCFIENDYNGDGIWIDTKNGANIEEFMQNLENTPDWQSNPTFKKIYDKDMNGIKDAKEFLLVFPAGLSGHMELGAAYGMGKKCYAIGRPDKYETLYLMLDSLHDTVDDFLQIRHGVTL